MNIVYNLKKFFTEQQNEAAIPGLGVFYKSNVDENGNELPEGESVVLFIEKTPRSNAFVNFLGYEEDLTENEAIEVIENWVATILNDLRTQRIANIPELGRFEIHKDKVLFIPEPAQNLNSPAEYGLEELPAVSEKAKKSKKRETIPNTDTATPHTTETIVENTTPQSGMRKSTLIWLIVIAAIVVLTGAGIVCYRTVPGFKNFVDNSVESVRGGFQTGFRGEPRPIVIGTDTDAERLTAMPIDDDIFAEEPKSFPAGKSDAIAEQPTRPATRAEQPTRAAETQTFKVIGGAFSVKANAERFQAKMKKDGYASSEVFFDNQKQLHYVALGAFDTEAKAIEFRDRVRRTKNIDCWIYRK